MPIVKVSKNVRIPLSDGHFLAADVHLPDGAGRVPAVFDYYPYRKDDAHAHRLRQHHQFAERGYAALRLDVRGTGNSSGVALDEYTLREQLDAVEAIQWMRQQPWCNGHVGMFGLSYGGFNSLQVAMRRPPGLKAICPMYFTDNRYTDDIHYRGGGLQMLDDMGTYITWMITMNAMPPHPDASGAQWAEMWEERLQNDPWALAWLANQTYNSYWKHGSLCEDYGAVECPTYLIGGWRDGYVNCNLRTFAKLRCPKKLLIGPWMHTLPDEGPPGPRIDHIHEMVRFFDHWLKGMDNGVMKEPPITLYVQSFDPPDVLRSSTSGFWRHEQGWPLARASERFLYFGAEGRLLEECPRAELRHQYTYDPTSGTTSATFTGSTFVLPADQRSENSSSSNWISAPLKESVEILGDPCVRLRIACTTGIASVAVRLIDVAPDGTAALVCKGILNLTHRVSHEHPSPLTPGETVEVEILLDTTSWVFAAGHRIQVGLSGADFPTVWPSPDPYQATIFCGTDRASRLVLPVVGTQKPALPTPRFQAPEPFAPTARLLGEPQGWRVTRDHINRAVEVFRSSALWGYVGSSTGLSRGHEVTATVQELDPARAGVRVRHWMTLEWPGRTIHAYARAQLESTRTAFQLTVQLDITMEDAPFFQRRWVRSFERNLL